MVSDTHMNIVLGQGNAIKEVHNVRKLNLELNQQSIAQQTEEKKKAQKSKVQDSETRNRIADKDQGTRNKRKKTTDEKKRQKEDPGEKDPLSTEGNLIDITV